MGQVKRWSNEAALSTWDVACEVVRERIRQDNKWGGADHDDLHSPNEFADFILERLAGLEFANNPRKALIESAALAVAAIESMDRRATKDLDKLGERD